MVDPNEQVDSQILNKPEIPDVFSMDGETRDAFLILFNWVKKEEDESHNRLHGKVFFDYDTNEVNCFLEDLQGDKIIQIRYKPKTKRFAVQLVNHYNDQSTIKKPITIKKKITTMENITMTLREFKDNMLKNEKKAKLDENLETTTVGNLKSLLFEEKKQKEKPSTEELDRLRNKIASDLIKLRDGLKMHIADSALETKVKEVYRLFMDLPSFETHIKQHNANLSLKDKERQKKMLRMRNEVKGTLKEEADKTKVTVGKDADDATINKAVDIAKKNKTDVMFESGDSDNDLLGFVIPEWAMSALVNGDYTGLEDYEEEKLKEFVKNTVNNFGNAHFIYNGDESDNLGFVWRNDIDSLGGNAHKLYIRPDSDSNWMKKHGSHLKKKISEQINQKDYLFYIFSIDQNKILSGWEYREDALDRAKEMRENGWKVKIFSKSYLINNLKLNPDDNSSWGKELVNESHQKDEIVLRVVDDKGIRIYYPGLTPTGYLTGYWLDLDKALNRVNILMNQRQEEFPIYLEKGGGKKRIERNRGKEVIEEYEDEGFETGTYNKNEELEGLYGKPIRPFNKINWREVYQTIEHNNDAFENKAGNNGVMLNTGDFMDEYLLSDSEIAHLVDMQLIWLYQDAYPVFYETETPTFQEFTELAKQFWEEDYTKSKRQYPEPREPRGHDLDSAD